MTMTRGNYNRVIGSSTCRIKVHYIGNIVVYNLKLTDDNIYNIVMNNDMLL